ncbi:hypothetical protein KGF56_003512 [Candida oxycetoniae]|uniref:Reduced meiotic recombination protein 1 n=1 Tax=Candida oxycetoniae TaxID=497107 RepID=A0AAI9SVN0_9ASCO|nr:uncharacterized protein KGF56_003512 [Candida oxycetoniae]KAI3403694.2 hypothetical protein KGF56_003512 [Candida oxycetoniae]
MSEEQGGITSVQSDEPIEKPTANVINLVEETNHDDYDVRENKSEGADLEKKDSTHAFEVLTHNGAVTSRTTGNGGSEAVTSSTIGNGDSEAVTSSTTGNGDSEAVTSSTTGNGDSEAILSVEETRNSEPVSNIQENNDAVEDNHPDDLDKANIDTINNGNVDQRGKLVSTEANIDVDVMDNNKKEEEKVNEEDEELVYDDDEDVEIVQLPTADDPPQDELQQDKEMLTSHEDTPIDVNNAVGSLVDEQAQDCIEDKASVADGSTESTMETDTLSQGYDTVNSQVRPSNESETSHNQALGECRDVAEADPTPPTFESAGKPEPQVEEHNGEEKISIIIGNGKKETSIFEEKETSQEEDQQYKRLGSNLEENFNEDIDDINTLTRNLDSQEPIIFTDSATEKTHDTVSVYVTYNNEKYLLYPNPNTDTDRELSTLFSDNSIQSLSIEEFFGLLRSVEGFIFKVSEEIILSIPQFGGISLTEDNVYCKDLTIGDFIDLYYKLCDCSDSKDNIPTFLNFDLTTQSRFITKFNGLVETVQNKGGFEGILSVDAEIDESPRKKRKTE